MMADAIPLVRLENVSRIFDDGAVVALREINLSFDPGEFTVIVGPSGSGKSSLIHIMGGFDTASTGTVYWKGGPVLNKRAWTKLRRNEIGFIFQEFHLLPTLTALENVDMALSGQGLSSMVRTRRATELLEQVGLGARMKHLPHALSGGERQRVAIARSIANRPILLLADEPTGNLDSENARMVADLLLDTHKKQQTALVMVTHDDALAARSQRRIRIKDGQIVS
jgi:ABC-type lipoprotein export system ATPase subunit